MNESDQLQRALRKSISYIPHKGVDHQACWLIPALRDLGVEFTDPISKVHIPKTGLKAKTK